jgi:hypothetical protein
MRVKLGANSIQILDDRNRFKFYALTGDALLRLRKSASDNAALTARG